MEEYFSRKEYMQLQKQHVKECGNLKKEIIKLKSELKKVKEDYEILLETATENLEDSRN